MVIKQLCHKTVWISQMIIYWKVPSAASYLIWPTCLRLQESTHFNLQFARAVFFFFSPAFALGFSLKILINVKKYFYGNLKLIFEINFSLWQSTPILLPGKSHGQRSLVGYKSMGSQRVGRDWVTSLSLFTSVHWRRKWQPTPVFLPGESQGRGAWWSAIYGVTQSQTQLRWLSSSSSGLLRGLAQHYILQAKKNFLIFLYLLFCCHQLVLFSSWKK